MAISITEEQCYKFFLAIGVGGMIIWGVQSLYKKVKDFLKFMEEMGKLGSY
jgi:hypothetical protein